MKKIVVGGLEGKMGSFLVEAIKAEEDIELVAGVSEVEQLDGEIPIYNDIQKVLELTDLVLLDIKHIDDEKCKNLVGRSNTSELKFARYLSNNNIPIWIRQVLIPGFTDDKEDLLKLKNFISTLNSVQKIEILPYHNMGAYKWKKLGFKYELENVREATNEDVAKAKEILGIT